MEFFEFGTDTDGIEILGELDKICLFSLFDSVLMHSGLLVSYIEFFSMKEVSLDYSSSFSMVAKAC